MLEYPYYLKHKLPEVTTVTEDAKIELEVSVEDENAVVTWYHDDIEITPEKSRYLEYSTKSLLNKLDVFLYQFCH